APRVVPTIPIFNLFIIASPRNNYFVEPAVIPLTIYLWVKIKMIIIGNEDRTDNAINSDQFVLNCPTNCLIPSVTGHLSLSFNIVNEYKNSPHASKKLKAAAVYTPGFASGKIILKNVPHLEQPSIAAASSKVFGIIKKYVLNTKIAKGIDSVILAIITPKYEFNSPMFANIE